MSHNEAAQTNKVKMTSGGMKETSMTSQTPSSVSGEKVYERKNRAKPLLGMSTGIGSFNNEMSSENSEAAPSSIGTSASDGLCGVNQGRTEALKVDPGLSGSACSSVLGTNLSWGEINADVLEYADVLESADWTDLSQVKMLDLVLSHLDTFFRLAIEKIVASGYSEDVATNAILRSTLHYYCMDPVPHIVANALSFLESAQDTDSATNCLCENLQQLERCILAEMAFILKEVWPKFSMGDVLWLLLVCNLNITLACGVHIDPAVSFVDDGTSIGGSAVITPPHKAAEVKSKAAALNKSDPAITAALSRTKKKNALPILHRQVSDKNSRHPASGRLDKPFVPGTSQLPNLEKKFVSSIKAHSSYSKRDPLRQKSVGTEKNYLTYGSEGSSKAGILGRGGPVLYNALNFISESSAISLKTATVSIGNVAGITVFKDIGNKNPSVLSEPTSPAASYVEPSNAIPALQKTEIPSLYSTMNIPPAFPDVSNISSSSAPDTDLSLQLLLEKSSAIVSSRCNAVMPDCNYGENPLSDANLDQWFSQFKKEERILRLLAKEKKLQTLLQEWTEWTNERVMQAARRLGKDKAEFDALRREKEEVARIRNNKQAPNDISIKNVADMQDALAQATSQLEQVNAAGYRLQVENAVLKKEVEAAKLHAVESEANCKEAAEREKKNLMALKTLADKKTTMQEELRRQRGTLAQLLQEKEQKTAHKVKLESRWKQVEKEKNALLQQASLFREEREKIEARTKMKELKIRSKSDKDIQKCNDDIARLEKEKLQLRQKLDSLRIAALKQSIEIDGVNRDRECVMCLSEENSVVYLPCAHQVVCKACNELHEKQGMKSCPSCRTPIQRRVSVRYAQT